MDNYQPEISVEDTNAQALQAKLSAIQKGYFADPYAQEFVRAGPKKDILMHRGYWARQNIFKVMVEKFLNANPETEKQVISLGCGYDTLYYNIKDDPAFKDNKFIFYEIDLPSVVSKKVKKINNSPRCKQTHPELIQGTDSNYKTIITPQYKLFECDLTHTEEFNEKLTKQYGIDFTKPTFVFAECVLTYIEPKYTDALLQYFYKNFDFVQIMDYEMFNPNDPFGKQMVKNFQLKGCPLQGIFEYPTIQSQKERLEKIGFKKIEIYDMLNIYNKCCDQIERKRIEKIELLDEFEEWIVFLGHYFISLQTNFKSSEIETKFSSFSNKVKLNPDI